VPKVPAGRLRKRRSDRPPMRWNAPCWPPPTKNTPAPRLSWGLVSTKSAASPPRPPSRRAAGAGRCAGHSSGCSKRGCWARRRP
jgi:hypothetical protein